MTRHQRAIRRRNKLRRWRALTSYSRAVILYLRRFEAGQIATLDLVRGAMVKVGPFAVSGKFEWSKGPGAPGLDRP